MSAPRVAFRELQEVWFQITGTLCNLACRHCFNASGPRDPWLTSLDAPTVRRYIREADTLGAREFYFTGGERFLHPDILPLLQDALAVAPATVFTNGTVIGDATADALARIAAAARYSLEIRVRLDAPTADENDAVRGRGGFVRALAAARRLAARDLHPIVTAPEVAARAQEPRSTKGCARCCWRLVSRGHASRSSPCFRSGGARERARTGISSPGTWTGSTRRGSSAYRHGWCRWRRLCLSDPRRASRRAPDR
jgi:organic radical activating enzyme